MNLKIAVLGLFLVGCGGGDPDVYDAWGTKSLWQYQADCLSISSWFKAKPEVLTANAQLAKALMEPTVGDFCKRFSGVYIEMVDKQHWAMDKKNECWGSYNVFQGIRINNRLENLVHEFFHVVDAQELKTDSYKHPHWDTNGRDALNFEYVKGLNIDFRLED